MIAQAHPEIAKETIGHIGACPCESSKWTRQFMRPSGWIGRWFGHVMASKNAAMNELAVKLLNVKPDEHILEIGFGPGHAIQLVAARAVRGFVAGVDLSDVMIAQASARNKPAIQTGRVELKQGSALALHYPDARFDKVMAVNNFHIWPDQNRALLEVRRVLKDDGMLLLPLRMKHPTRTVMVPPGFTDEEIVRVRHLLQQVGFQHIRTEPYAIDQGVTAIWATR